METCDTQPALRQGDTFESIRKEMLSDLYWVRFFARPCCPAPDAQGAMKMLDRLSAEVESRDDFSPSEVEELIAIIDRRREWYPTSGICKG